MAPSAPLDESFVDRAFRVTADAYLASPTSWERAIQSALSELLAFLACEPEQTQACIAIGPGEHPAALIRRDQIVERFATLLGPGFAVPADPPPPVVAEGIGGGILELIRIHVEERRVEHLPSALPNATLIALAPFVGSEQARRVAANEPRVQTSR